MKRVKSLWFLLLIPLAVLCLPGFFLVMVTGTRLLSIFVGPINIWNTPAHDPSAIDIAGEYELAEKSIAFAGVDGDYFSRTSTIALNRDHTVKLTDVPSYDNFGEKVECLLNATGTWKTETSAYGSELALSLGASWPVKGVTSCGPMNFTTMNLLGRYPPYRIWYIVGDPDSDTGLSYVRRR